MAESTAITETKKIINPRVEIDTSPPFESVKEAVDRFGGSGPWIPHHLLRLATAVHHDNEEFDVEKIEEQAEQLQRDLIMKEQETLNVLKELEAAKRFVEGLKVNLMPEFSSFIASPEDSNLGLSLCPGLMFTELNQAKLNLNKTSVDLAAIQASVESLNKKLRKDKILLESRSKMHVHKSEENHHICMSTKPDTISLTLSKEVNFEAEQFKKMTEASRYEVMQAMTEIERTKNCIRMAEMRLNAAKKMEEAAKAVEAIAVAERNNNANAVLKCQNSSHDGITLTFEEYQSLSQKAKQAEELCNTKFIDTNGLQRRTNEDHHIEVPILEKFEETIKENKQSRPTNVVVEDTYARTRSENNFTKFKFRNSKAGNRNHDAPGFRSTTTSIGDVLSRKLVVQDEVMMGRHVENGCEREHVSLSQMLREQSRLILHPTDKTTTADHGNVEKRYFVQRKKFGFIQVPIPTYKQSKKKAQPLNQR